jgi:hypothetical protein
MSREFLGLTYDSTFFAEESTTRVLHPTTKVGAVQYTVAKSTILNLIHLPLQNQEATQKIFNRQLVLPK